MPGSGFFSQALSETKKLASVFTMISFLFLNHHAGLLGVITNTVLVLGFFFFFFFAFQRAILSISELINIV